MTEPETQTQTETDWRTLTGQAAVVSHLLVGWLYWDPQGIANYAALGVPDGMGYYIATRAAPLVPAGPEVVTAVFGSIHPAFVAVSLDLLQRHTNVEDTTRARDDAVATGLRTHALGLCDGLAEMAEPLWDVADHLPLDGRALFAAHLRHRRPDDPLVSAWLAVNCIREWRGDTHWALHVAEGVDGTMAGLLDAAWRGHDDDWLPRSRGADDDALERARDALTVRGLATGGRVNDTGIALRQQIEDRLDDLCTPGWQRLGSDGTARLVGLVEPFAATLIGRIDATAGDRWMPAARPRVRRNPPDGTSSAHR